jgi:hypothetical protein
MRQDAWRRDPASYPLRGTLMPRFVDVDVWQHLNNTALITMHGEVVQQAVQSLLGPDAWRASTPVLSGLTAATDFLAEGYYPTPLDWGARVTAAGEFPGDCLGDRRGSAPPRCARQSAQADLPPACHAHRAPLPVTPFRKPRSRSAGIPMGVFLGHTRL